MRAHGDISQLKFANSFATSGAGLVAVVAVRRVHQPAVPCNLTAVDDSSAHSPGGACGTFGFGALERGTAKPLHVGNCENQ